MPVHVHLFTSDGKTWIGEADYAAPPAIGQQIMFMNGEWQVYHVEGLRHWPAIAGDEACAPTVHAYVRLVGALD